MKIFFAAFILTTLICLDRTDKLSQEQEKLILSYCAATAKKLRLSGVTFRLAEKIQHGIAYYDPHKREIFLSLNLQNMILKKVCENRQDNPEICDFILIHELGHHKSFMQGYVIISKIALFHLIGTVFYTIENKLGVNILSSLKPFVLHSLICMGISYVISSYMEERFADRFATEQMCFEYGLQKTSPVLFSLLNTWASRMRGYQDSLSLFKYATHVEKYGFNHPIENRVVLKINRRFENLQPIKAFRSLIYKH